MENQKIKFVRHSGKTDIYLNHVLQENADSPEIHYAMQFFEAFSPEVLFGNLHAQNENAVIVFRTSVQQMQEFFQIMQGNTDSLDFLLN